LDRWRKFRNSKRWRSRNRNSNSKSNDLVAGVPPITGVTEEYDGTSWTNNPTGLNTARGFLAAAGIQTAALAFGGEISPTTGATEEYDGSTWTSVNSMNTARYQLAGRGTQTAALAFGGRDPALLGATEEYDGTSWATNPASLNTARASMATAGTQTLALSFGGYNGTAYTSSNRRIYRCRSSINSYNHSFLTLYLIYLINVESIKK
jgi:hypothetical protein